MAKRTAVPAPAAAIDDDLPWDQPKSDDETANLFDSSDEEGEGTGGPVDAEDDDELETKLRASLDQPKAEPPKTVVEVLSMFTIGRLSARMKKQPLSAQANEWVVASLVKVVDRLRAIDAGDAAQGVVTKDELLADLRALVNSAEERGVPADDASEAEKATWDEACGILAWKGEVRADYEIVDDLGGSANTGQDLAPEQISTENILGVHEKTGALTLGVIVEIDLDEIEPDPTQARDEGADDELAESIKVNGFYTNRAIELRVHPNVAGGFSAKYMIVDGERRYRGARAAGLERIPATITDAAVDEGDRLVRQVVMNEGKRLKPMEEARTFKRIMAAKGWNIQQLADHLGRSKSTISDRLAIVDVPADFARFFEEGILSAAAAPILRPLAGLPDKARKRVVDAILDDYNWDDAVSEARANKKAIPVTGKWGSVESLVEETLAVELRVIDPKQGADYKGKTVTVGKTVYALDVAAYDAAVKKAEANPAAKKKIPDNPDVAKYKAEEKKRKEREKIAREKEEAARDLKKRQHRTLVEHVLAEVPNVIDAKWALFLIRLLTANVFNVDGDELVNALGIAPVKARGYDAEAKAIVAHAEKLDTKGRIRLALQLAAYSDQPCYNKEEDWTLQAATLLKIDPKKLKVADPVHAEIVENINRGGAKKSAKKRR